MSTLVFPTLPGLMWDIVRSPKYSTEVMQSTSGKEIRAAYYGTPIWTWKLKFEFLRGYNAFTEFAALSTFFNRVQGQYDSFLWSEPGDSSVTAQGFGAGDGATTAFQLQRMMTPAPLQQNYWDPGLYTPSTVPRTNNIIQSGDFTQAAWTKTSLTDGGAAVDPSGQMAAWLYTSTAGGATITQTIAGLTAGITYTVSLWVLCAAGTTLKIGTTEGTSATATLNAAYQRVSYTFTAAGTSTVFTIGAGASWGSGVAIKVAFPQNEAASAATPYIPTTTASVTVTPNYWPKTGDAFEPIYNLNPATPLQVYRNDWQGNQLLYPTARTNVAPNSNNFASWAKAQAGTGTAAVITAGYAAGPDGVVGSASRVQFNQGAGVTATDYSFIYDPVTVVTGQTYITGIWIKSNTGSSQPITISIAGAGASKITYTVGIGWQLLPCNPWAVSGASMAIYVGQFGDTSHAVTGDFLVAYAQLELGSIPTSYIPTTSAAVTLTDYTISGSGLVTFTNAPLTGAVLTWTGAYFWRVRFKQDSLDMTQFAQNFWDLKQLEFQSVK